MSSSSASSIKEANLQFVKIISNSQRAIIRQLRDRCTGEFHAVKEFVDRPISAIGRLQIYRENEYLRDSNSPFIVKHRGNFGEGDEFKIVLEYVDGSNIGSCGPIPEPTLSRYAHQILQGLNYLHSKRIVHGDVNPENILINGEDQVKICGLGNSKKLPGETVTFERWKGTSYGYRCPDKLREYPCDGYASDIWGFGMTILHGHIGRHPIMGPYANQNPELMYQLYVWEEKQRPLTREDSSEDFKKFISHCMHKEPSDRWKPIKLLEHAFITKHQDGNNAQHLNDQNPHEEPSSSSHTAQ
ncbi:mitogen-activated protein kinase kinase 7-like [Magnolia sinica]|uniref:mitogen-activated protein kinase kinase 7-like n=1 Tax=Magnolia sinica TaxID=86752 RepID=UPI002657C0E4|nr:mitogen-activated protein kinase kinase 7-like [Magnolia sinica]XP_058113289.1 mitogen-activated protein kinase kinase 7-like [Magnolia sinica]